MFIFCGVNCFHAQPTSTPSYLLISDVINSDIYVMSIERDACKATSQQKKTMMMMKLPAN